MLRAEIIKMISAGLQASVVLLGVASAADAQTGVVDFTANQQQVEGFGFSQAFGASQSVSYLSSAMQAQVWDLMFNPKSGLGMDLLRIGFNTGYNIEPNSPGSPSGTPAYQFDGSDGMQVQTAQIAQHYGVNDFFAVSWSAPGYMKTNGSPDGGGTLCGVTGATCASGDWRQAYANYLVQYVNDYKSEGVPIGSLGVQNEPDYAASYQAMTLNAAQVVSFVNGAFGPTVRSQLPGVRTMCCDAFNWSSEQTYTGTLPYYAPYASYIDISTAHEYGFPAKFPQATTKPSWMTEWATLSSTDQLAWDAGVNSGSDADGMYLANDIIQAFNAGNVNEYNYWWGAVNQPNALVRVYIGNFAGYFVIPGRYYAMAALSRFVRPGAYRVTSTNTNTSLNVVAFRNTDGSKVLEVLNTGTSAATGSFTVDTATGTTTSGVKTYLTDQTDSLNETDTAVVTGTQLNVPLPPRSLTTVIIPPVQLTGTVQLILQPTISKLGDGSFESTLKITNTGSGTANDLMLNAATLGSSQAAPTPLTILPETVGLGALAPGGYTTVPLNYGTGAGSSGSTVLQKFSGTYAGGTFGGTSRTVLP